MQVIVCADGVRRNALRPLTRDEQIVNFWEKVNIGKPDECWLWKGCTCGSGHKYGSAYFERKLTKAHRIAWEITHGPIPKGLLACHHCDTPLCVNPSHLFIGTNQDNQDDMERKGRRRYGVTLGEDNPLTKITKAQAAEVRRLSKLGVFQKDISSITGVTKTNVGAIVQRRTWRHIQ